MNATQPRTDIHRPTEMDPQHYEICGVLDNAVDYEPVRNLVRQLHTTDRLGRGIFQCHHCGARIRYVALMRHLPTGEIIAIGETCLDNRFSLASKAQFDRLRKAAALARQEQRIKTSANEFVEAIENADLRNVLDRNTDLSEIGFNDWSLSTVRDIRNSLWNRYGSLTERQVALVERLIREVPERQAAQQARAAEEARMIPAPTGRITFEGIVISRKIKDTDFGPVWKITVKVETTEGVYLVWVSEPRAIVTQRGDRVRMTATLTRSGDKPSFAFGKRPSNADITERPAEEMAEDALAD